MKYYICSKCNKAIKTITTKNKVKHCDRRLIKVNKDQYIQHKANVKAKKAGCND